MYAKGDGVPKDFVLAHTWFNLAAARGDSDAQKNIDNIARKMMPSQITEAQRLAQEWKPKVKDRVLPEIKHSTE
jgi:TPR repeat protein